MKKENVKKYKIGGMHCISCAMLIESELEDSKIAGEAECNYAKSELILKSQKEINDAEVVKSIENLGYKATPV